MTTHLALPLHPGELIWPYATIELDEPPVGPMQALGAVLLLVRVEAGQQVIGSRGLWGALPASPGS